MKKYRITRESLLDGSHHARVRAGQGPHVRFMTDAERSAHVAQMLARAPRPGRIWVFGYGSLMWNPAFHYVERHTARIHGFHRQFCLWARGGRGSPERPGLMLALESGGSCTGVPTGSHPRGRRDRTRRAVAAGNVVVVGRCGLPATLGAGPYLPSCSP